MSKVTVTINGKAYEADAGKTILQVARENNVYIPTLCYLDGVNQYGGCRLCMVEVETGGKPMRNLQAACMIKISDGMVIKTNTERVRTARKVNLELLLSAHPKDCLSCARSLDCELQTLAKKFGVIEPRFEGERQTIPLDVSAVMTRDMSKCVNCRRCVSMCNSIQKIGVLNPHNRGFKTVIQPSFGKHIADTDCTNCGQCISVCPVGALRETDAIAPVLKAIDDPNKYVIAQVAPAVRVAIGEPFGMPSGSVATGKMVTALKALNFDEVFDVNFGADLTIMEEGTEFLERAKAALTGGTAVLPMMTSCSPGWIKFIEHRYPELLDNLSSCKSPHMMQGALIKTYYAEKLGKDPKDVYVVSVMPCTAKKFEIIRPEMKENGVRDVDAVLTTRELANMIKQADIDFVNLPDSEFDPPMGISTGAADIFGVTGGVMEAALRTVYELVTGRQLPFDNLHVAPLGTSDQIKIAELTFEGVLPEYGFLEGFTARVAVTSGFDGAAQVMEMVKAGEAFHFIEVMGCPGGCIVGGGQPRGIKAEKWAARKAGIYSIDEGKPLRKSHENEAVMQLYKEFLGEPCGHKSHELLHTHYTARGRYNELLRR
ncbi:MAG: iron hydrogenase small subunit [Clostridia bacterium]|nr:iron hydrogenase small subunit [Clostridia bacterium]